MIEEGTTAPAFELPALVDGEYRRVALEEYLGQDVVILAFYPADFNPACDVESDLDQLDLFTMQQDVSVLAVGPDTLFAHEAFAEEYDLAIPLLSDSRREAGEAYDVAYEDRLGQSLLARAVFVVDHDGSIVYAWSSRDPASRVDVDEVKDALGDTGGDDTAFSRYRVGHAHYVEGRRAFTSAMEGYGDSDWMLAQSDFKRAREEFEEAEGHFASAVRFVDTDLYEEHYDAAKERATALWQAADWLGRSASEYSSGAGAAGKEIREDAERPLEEARAVAEPVDPDEWPPEEPPERDRGDDERPGSLVDDGDEQAALGVDIDEEGEDRAAGAVSADGEAAGGNATDGQTGAGAGASTDDAAGDADDESDESDEGDESSEGDIDDDELAEIEAEIAASGPDEPLDTGPPEERRSVVDETPAEGESGDAGAGDLDQSGDASGAGEPETPDEPGEPNEPALDAVEDDLSGGSGGGASLEPDDGDDTSPESGNGDAEPGEEPGLDEDDELEAIEPESTSLEGIPSEEELAADAEDGGAGADESADAEE